MELVVVAEVSATSPGRIIPKVESHPTDARDDMLTVSFCLGIL